MVVRLSGGGSSQSGGHIIENSSGTDLTQRDTLQFTGGLITTDDSTNGKTIVDDSPIRMTWTEWSALTPAEQQALPKVLITGAPDINCPAWNYIGTATGGSESVSIANISAIEFLIIVDINDSGNKESFVIPSQEIAGETWYRAGGYAPNKTTALVTIRIRSTEADVVIVDASVGSTDYTSGSVVRVYYR